MIFGIMAGLGLLGLIGIPILIIIYIIKPRYQERKISSTYIWKLSLKYRKRRIPLQWLKSLLLIVQCIIVAVLAFLLAKPYIGRATNSYDFRKVVIIDQSASMMTIEEGDSRFNRAIDAACEIAETATDDNTMSVILCSDEANVIINGYNDPGQIQKELKEWKAIGAKGTEANYGKAIDEAIKLMGSTSAGYVLITDHDYKDPGFFEVINVSKGTWNLAVDDAWEDVDDQEFIDVNGNGVKDGNEKDNPYYLEKIFYATYFSYNKQMTITPCAKIVYQKASMNEAQTDADYLTAEIVLPSMTLIEAGENTYAGTARFSYEYIRGAIGGRFTSYKSVEFYAKDESGNVISDAFTDDDKYFVMADGSNDKYRVLLMGNDAEGSLWYLESMLQSVSTIYVERVIPSELTAVDLNKKNSGYDLYVYDGCQPTKMPNDGAVWFINPPAGNYADFGFTIGQQQPVAGSGAKINVRQAGHSHMAAISEIEGIRGIKGVFAYTKFLEATIQNSEIAKLVTTADSTYPLVFAGETDNRIKFTVFSFDLKFTDFPLVFQNFPIMVQNIISNSVEHTILNGAGRPAYGDYVINEEITINVKPNCTELLVSVGEGELVEDGGSRVDTIFNGRDLSKAVKFTLNRGGLYTITQTLNVLKEDGTYVKETVTDQLFVRCNSVESNFALEGDILTSEELSDDQIATGSGMKKDLIYKYFAAALLLLLLIEWGLQYREQY